MPTLNLLGTLSRMTYTTRLPLTGIEQRLQAVFPEVRVLPPEVGGEVLIVHLRQHEPNPNDLRGLEVKFSLMELVQLNVQACVQRVEYGVHEALRGGLGAYQNHQYPEYRTF